MLIRSGCFRGAAAVGISQGGLSLCQLLMHQFSSVHSFPFVSFSPNYHPFFYFPFFFLRLSHCLRGFFGFSLNTATGKITLGCYGRPVISPRPRAAARCVLDICHDVARAGRTSLCAGNRGAVRPGCLPVRPLARACTVDDIKAGAAYCAPVLDGPLAL